MSGRLTKVHDFEQFNKMPSGTRVGIRINGEELERYSEAIAMPVGPNTVELLEPSVIAGKRYMEGLAVKDYAVNFTDEGEIIVDTREAFRVRYLPNSPGYQESLDLWDKSEEKEEPARISKEDGLAETVLRYV
jgi:hypothetical protein